MKGASVQRNWYEKEARESGQRGTVFACSPNGWVDNELAIDWLNKVYLPHINAER